MKMPTAEVARKSWFYIFFSLISFSLYSQQSLTSINGWNAYVHLPDDYYSTGSQTYPTIIFFPGTGEVGSDASRVLAYGPGAFIASGWNGKVTVNGTTIKPIIISLQPPSLYPQPFLVDLEIETIKKLYRVDLNSLHLTGLSHGGWMAEMYVGASSAYAAKIASVVAIQAVKPDDIPGYPAPFANFAKAPGHWLGYEQAYDNRDMSSIANTMNASVPGSATYFQTNVGGGGHCCWNTWYDPAHSDNYALNGANGNWSIYQYMLSWPKSGSNGPAGPPPPTPPTVNAGNPQTILLSGGGSGSGQSASFNFSNAPVAVSGWTNIHGSPDKSVEWAADPSGISLTSVSTANWAAVNGATSYDQNGVNAPGYFNNASVSVNNWYQFGDQAVFNIAKPQLHAWGLVAGKSYTVKISGSNVYSLNANPSRYTVIGKSSYGPIDVNENGTAGNGATFTGVIPYPDGTLDIFLNAASQVSNLAMVNGLQIIQDASNNTNNSNVSSNGASPTASATLSGTATANNGASIVSTSWTELSGPSTATIVSAANVSTPVNGLVVGTYVFQLTARDNNNLSNSSTSTVTVTAPASNTPPTVNAGNPQTIPLSGGGSGSGQSASFNFSNAPVSVSGWTNMHGSPSSSLVSATDPAGISLSSVATGNWAPVNGGTSYDQNGVNAPGYFNNASVSLNNWYQFEGLFDITKPQLHAWGLIPGKSYTVKISGSNVYSLNANPSRYTLKGNSSYGPFDVNENGTAGNGATFTGVYPYSNGTLDIFLNAVPQVSNLSMVDGLQIIQDGVAQPGSLILSGTAVGNSSANIVSTTWTKVSGPAVAINSPSNLTTSVSGLAVGTYVFQLSATDNHGLSNAASVTITVTGGAVNTAPTVSAGNPQTITMPTNSVTLSGTAAGTNGANIVATSWTKLSGPAATINLPSSANTTVSGLLAGTYVFQLSVTDNHGLTSSSNVTITANAAASGNGCGCDITISPSPADGTAYLDGRVLGVKPGNKVCIKAAHYLDISLFNFNGTKDNPVTIINCGGQVVVSGYAAYGFTLHGSSFVHVTGTGDPNNKYGFLIDGSAANTTYGFGADTHSGNMEVDHFEVSRTGVGMGCAPTPNCDPATWSTAWRMGDIAFHDNYVHDTYYEGFYIGNTQASYTYTCNGSTVTVQPQQIDSLKFYNNIMTNIGYTAAQISEVTGGALIHDNVITNYGTTNRDQHQTAILLGEISHGDIYNNKVLGGTGNGLEIFGAGLTKVYNNYFGNAGYDGSIQGQPAVFIDDKSSGLGFPALKIYFINNTIVSPRRNGISFYNDNGSVDHSNVIANNIIVNPGLLGLFPSYAYFDLQANPQGTLSNNLLIGSLSQVKFANPAANDYHLLAGSPAIGMGINAGSYGITLDLDQKLRGSGAYDAGCYQSGGTASTNSLVSAFGTASSLSVQNTNTDSVKGGGGAFSLGEKLSVYPNPATQLINIRWTGSYNGNAKLVLLDATGRIILTKEIRKYQDEFIDQLNIGSFSSGMYFLQIKQQDGKSKIIKITKP